ncbi:HK97 gp10 family phage protein [Heliobacterium chlorum]|uniref:HK97 gp10 family phage protein n=1 Tax=Heliobacterium chlorum TaxID=2698 RepID=A0ABR7T1Y6_HELCL|nr:HK97 gp10 family phage protein [Heliobacterium chlorum]MBC9783546.1 HK97 gp10 family phage protein [Heliobacterium chlorum]
MSVQTVFEIKFTGMEDLIKLAQKTQQLLDANVKNAVARTVLWGAGRIAESAPVDTGRLRSSVMGYLIDQYGMRAEGNPQAVAQGKDESITRIEGYRGVIGTNLAYALYVDLGIPSPETERKPLTAKQLRYLFAVGILQRGQGKEVIYTYKRKGSRGKGFFRSNIPLIDRYFQEQMQAAIDHAREGKLLPVTY